MHGGPRWGRRHDHFSGVSVHRCFRVNVLSLFDTNAILCVVLIVVGVILVLPSLMMIVAITAQFTQLVDNTTTE